MTKRSGWLIDCVQHLAARSPLLVRMASKIRNQAEAVMGYALAPSPNPEKNGEDSLLSLFRGRIESFVDVGANIGDWSARVTRIAPMAVGILFEPNPAAADALRARFSDNKRITIIQAAASNKAGRVRFFQEAACGETSSLVPGSSNPNAIQIEVRTISLSETLHEMNWSTVDFVKIDAEGNDFDVLQGAKESLQKRAIRVLQFEYNAAWALNGSTLAKAIRFLDEFGYSTRVITPKGPIEYNYSEFRDFFRYCNFVAAPPNVWAEVSAGRRRSINAPEHS